jgi:hypothetical protein
LRQLLVGKNDLELTPLGVLRARDLISREAHDSGCLYGALTALSRAAWDLDTGSLSRHYRKIISNGYGLFVTDAPGVWAGDPEASESDRREAARLRLEGMNRVLWLPGESSGVFHTTQSVVLDQLWADWVKRYALERPWPKDEVRLAALREGLRRLRET